MKKWIIGTLCLLAFGGLISLAILTNSNKTIFNDGYPQGNTAGNLYNGGSFCENNGIVYFSNPDDEGRLYSMDSTGNNLEKLSNDTATYINVDDNYIYYVRNNKGDGINYNFFSFYQNALVRMDKDGGNALVLDTDACSYASLIGNYIYYIHYDETDASTLYKVKIDGTERKKVANYAIYPCNAEEQYFYYHGTTTDGNVHRFDTKTDTTSTCYTGNSYNPIVEDGFELYYISGDHDNALIHTNLEYDNPTIVTNDSLDSYNVCGSTIYYQKYDKDGSGLCSIKNDGTDKKIISLGDYCNIHVTSSFVFFQDFRSGDTYYFHRSNPDKVMFFHPGIIK